MRWPELTIRELLYDEQKKLFGNPDGTFRDISYEDTKEMPVMDSVIRETLRMVNSTRSNRLGYCAD